MNSNNTFLFFAVAVASSLAYTPLNPIPYQNILLTNLDKRCDVFSMKDLKSIIVVRRTCSVHFD